jgi:hypothetical protein
VTGKVGQAVFALNDESFRLMRDGCDSGLSLAAAPGRYRLRCVVWEWKGGRFAAFNRNVEIK